MLTKFLKTSAAAAIIVASSIPPTFASTAGKIIEIKGEIIDTWCYFSGVMGDTDATRGTAHHTCALWCAAGGIPVGVRTEEGEVYMVLKFQGEDPLEQTDTLMEIQSDIITARGKHFLRDGVNYIVVENVIANDGITYLSHEDYDSVPPFSAPKKKK
ncbi:MAG: hypothetical protein ABJM29_03680 [Rhizobiaceae bacterium]